MRDIEKITDTSFVFTMDSTQELADFLKSKEKQKDLFRELYDNEDQNAYFINYMLNDTIKVFCIADEKQANKILEIINLTEALKPLNSLLYSMANQFTTPEEIKEMILLATAFHENTTDNLEIEESIEKYMENDEYDKSMEDLISMFEAQEGVIESFIMNLANLEIDDKYQGTQEYNEVKALQESLNSLYDKFGTLYPSNEDDSDIEIENILNSLVEMETEKLKVKSKEEKEEKKKTSTSIQIAYKSFSLGSLLDILDKTNAKGTIVKEYNDYFIITDNISLCDFLQTECTSVSKQGRERIKELMENGVRIK